MIKKVAFSLYFLVSTAWALVPVEGIVLGEAPSSLQQDPLTFIFSDIYDTSQSGENKKIKLYQATFKNGIHLGESCQYFGPPRYATPWQEKQAQRNVVATLQYIGLDTSIKAVGAYAKKLGLNAEEYGQLSENLVRNYCSPNLTIFSLKSVKKSLEHYYENSVISMIPSVAQSPYASDAFKFKTATEATRSREFDRAINNFRAFCSWGGDVSDYRMLAPYLNNRFIMAFVIKNMTGRQDSFDDASESVLTTPSQQTVQVTCQDLICRKAPSFDEFQKSFPLSVGSTGIATDLTKLYCHHFRLQDYRSTEAVPAVKKWIKEAELEDPILETSFFLSLMTGVPELMLAVDRYMEIPYILKSGIDERWNHWSREVLSVFGQDMLFEESLKVKSVPLKDVLTIRTQGFALNFTVTLGEMDRIMDDTDKLDAQFDLKFSKNYLRELRTKWGVLAQEVDLEGQEAFRKDMMTYINHQLQKKDKLFIQKVWNDEFARIVADQLLSQALAYQGPLFESYQDEIITIPVRFSYGLFALSYLRYRTDVSSGRLKLSI